MKKSKFLTAFVVLVYIFLFAPLVIIAKMCIRDRMYITGGNGAGYATVAKFSNE